MNRGAGWIAYAWIVLIVLGVWNIIEGIVAISRSSFFTSTGAHYVYANLNTWGWIILIWGILEVLAAGSVWRGGQWGRWFGIFVAGIAIILQFLALPIYPFWALIDILLYSLVLYGLAEYGGTHESLGS
ncbi:MAG TPA: hypothetical protein VL117_04305 [Thermoleophilia bacterium]|nr:hypothetical protein [Thermoleophilia bacterium]